MILRLGARRQPDEGIQKLLGAHLASCRLTGLATARGGAALDITFAVKLLSAEESLALVAALNRLDGVQGVEFKS